MGDDRRAMDINRDHWDELVPVHKRSAFYDLQSFLEGRNSVDDVSMGLLGDVTGKRILHLQCHFGMDSLSLARLGAMVTGVDFSPTAIEAARDLSNQLGVNAHFIEANIYDLPEIHDVRYDIVFTSHGTITWLPDIQRWAEVVANFLGPGGRFVFVDGHPLSWTFKQDDVSTVEFEFGYFNAGREFQFHNDYSYASDPGSPRLTNRDSREWHHRLDEILNALASAGLHIELVREYPQIAWRLLPFLEQEEDGWWRMPAGHPELPLMLATVASQPE
jgi:SAM-dependent methyltransferase